MGCDVHAFIEYGCNQEHPFDVGEIHLGRNYLMFAFLAGVRGTEPPVIPPKGIPDKLGYYAKWAYYLFVDEKREETDWDGRSVNLRDANRWTEDKLSTERIEEGRNGDKVRYISHPDWHTPTWFTSDEFEQVIEAVEAHLGEDPDYEGTKAPSIYYGVLAMLKALPDSRIVMWWDN